MSTENAKFMKNASVGWTDTHGKYYPHDFDPSKVLSMGRLLRAQGKKQVKKMQEMNMRMMMPFSMSCLACGEHMYIGTKFNSRCEKVQGEDYLGVSIYRFYGRCKTCHNEFTFRTDPKSANYVLESGGKRQYEAWQDADAAVATIEETEQKKKEDAMAQLEQKRQDMEREMQAHDDLDRLMIMNRRLNADRDTLDAALGALFSGDGHDEIIAKARAAGIEILDEDEEDEVDAFLSMQERARDEELERTASSSSSGADLRAEVRALQAEEKKEQENSKRRPGALFNVKKKAKVEEVPAASPAATASTSAATASASATVAPTPAIAASTSATAETTPPAPAAGLGGLLGGYSDSSDE